MPFPVPLASTLSGATLKQLAYWRKRTRAAAPLLVPAAKESGRYLYSWADVVALRTLVYLRQEKSLHRIRKAVERLRRLEAGEWEHLADYRLVSTGDSIIVVTQAGAIYDLDRSPGAILDEALMKDILAPFTAHGRVVPGLQNPRPKLAVDPHILDGYPVVAGSRIPFDLVAGLADDGLGIAEIRSIYPSVELEAVNDAQAFARQVEQAAA